jgi:hypothetical protein
MLREDRPPGPDIEAVRALVASSEIAHLTELE